MPKPTNRDVHVDRPLTNMSVAYMQSQAAFIADKVFPVVPVQKKSDQYYVYEKADWYRIEAKERAPATESAGGGYALSTADYVCKRYAFHKDVDDELRANADMPLRPDEDATEYVTRQLMLKREKLWVSKYFTTGIWGAADFTPGTLWDAVGSDPIGDVDAKKDTIEAATGYRPNVLVVGPQVHTVLKNHADVQERIKYTQRGIVTEELLAALLGVDKYLVARAVENTAAENQTATMSYMYGKNCLLVYAAPSPSIMQPSGGYTFTWAGLLGAGATGSRIKRFRMDEIESDRIEGDMAFDQKVVAADLGQFFSAVIS